MARREIISLIDDIDGTEADATVEFSIDKVGYAIDLSGANETALRDALAPYVDAARRISKPRRRVTR